MRCLPVVLLSLALAPRAFGQADEPFQRGVEAYRRGDHAEAEAYWRTCLEFDLPPEERARVAYDLGNAAFRRERMFEAVGWYRVSLQLSPRQPDAWHNLELACMAAELEPVDRGDLRSTIKRLLEALDASERRLLVLLALVPFGLVLGFEAVRGGRNWRRLALVGLLGMAVATAPWVHGRRARASDPHLVVRTPNVPLRAEPRSELVAIGELAPGDEVERVDALPGWTRVETADGVRGWVPEDALFSLRPRTGETSQ